MTINEQDFRARLIAARSELESVAATNDDAAKPVELDQTRVGRLSRMDAMQAQAMSKETQRRRELQLLKIGAAFKRLDSGDLGYCIECGDEISEQRLQVELKTLLCISCANLKEKKQRRIPKILKCLRKN